VEFVGRNIPAMYCRIFHSCIFRSYIFERIEFSTPAFSVSPSKTQMGIPACLLVCPLCLSGASILWVNEAQFFIDI